MISTLFGVHVGGGGGRASPQGWSEPLLKQARELRPEL